MNSSDTVRVHLYDDYYLNEQFDTQLGSWSSEDHIYEVPAEQLKRWEDARDAWEEAQAEIKKLISARSVERMRQRAEAREREQKRRAEIRRELYGWAQKSQEYGAARAALVQSLRSDREDAASTVTTGLLLTILDRPSPFDLHAPIVRVAPGTCRETSFGWIHVKPSCRCPNR